MVDPAFAQAFQVADPTPRFAHILAAVPPLVMAPLPRIVRATLLLGAELARSIEARGLPLAPWRHADSLVTRYEAATTSIVLPAGGLASVGPGATSGAAAAAARKQRRAAEDQQRVALKLLKLGLAMEPAAAAAAGSEPASPPTPTSSDVPPQAESPTSVVDLSAPHQGELSRAFASGAPGHEWFCCGWRSQPDWRQAERSQQHRRRRGAARAA